MNLGGVSRLSLTFALTAGFAGSAAAQFVPTPHPRPAHLTAKAPAVAIPVAAVPVAAAAPAPSSIEALLSAAPATVVEPASVPPAPNPVPVVVEQPAPAPASEPQVAAAPEPPPSLPPAPAPKVEVEAPAPPAALAPQSAPIEVGLAPGRQLAAASGADIGAKGEGQTLRKVNTYFNGIRTLVGNFTQVGPDGSRTAGKFFLAKPGKVRFYYQQPSTTDIIADGRSVVVRDRKLATQDVYPLSQTPLRFLLDPNLDLARDSKVVGVYEEPGLVSVAIEEETTFGGKARVLLSFASVDSNTFELKQWTITDAQGLDTTIAVSELDSRTKPDEKLFKVDYTRYNR